jgi:ketosteroid isomerase-like protein
MHRSVLLMICSVAPLVGCASKAPAPAGPDTVAIGKILDSLDAAQQGWFARGMIDSMVTGYYTPDAILMQSNSAALRGSDAIRAAFAEMTKTADFRLNFKMASRHISDSLAIEQGQYTIEIRSKPDTAKVVGTDHGNYVTAFVNRNGQWRALYDISASEVPIPMPGPSPAPPKKK